MQDQKEQLPGVTEKAISRLDNLGIFASILCLIHCAAMPFLIAALPFIGMNLNLKWIESDLTENILIAFIIGFAVFAILPSYRKHHNKLALAGLTTGTALVLVVIAGRGGFLPDSWELPIIAAGNSVLVLTHLYNRKLIHGSFLGHGQGDGKVCCTHNHDQN